MHSERHGDIGVKVTIEVKPKYMYLSFADESGFRGACIVEADNITRAIMEAHRLGCNPGGDVAGVDVPEETPIDILPHIGKLMDLEYLKVNGFAPKRAGGACA